MAGRKENLKSLFSNTRTRVIIIFTTIILLGAVTIGLVKFVSSSNIGPVASVDLRGTPQGIRAVPGGLEPTAQYETLQEEQNLTQAKNALQKGGSAIPTIIRTQSIGSGGTIIGAQNGGGAVGFSTLAQQQDTGGQQSLWLQSLKDNFCSKEAVTQVVNEGGHLVDLKKACSCIQLQDVGYKLSELNQVCSCKELKAAGINARQLKSAGYTAARLRACGFDACELRNAGFTAQEMKDGGYSDGELKGAGFSEQSIARASGIPNGTVAADIRKAGCGVAALQKLRANGVSAGAIRRITGCSAAQLKAAGYSATDLNNAGFSAAELAKVGFTPAELKQAGYSARDLLNAGFTPEQLATAGYNADEIAAAEAELPPGISAEDVKKAGCSVEVLKKERLAGVSAKVIRENANCSPKDLKAAGFTDKDLANAGLTPDELKALGLTSNNKQNAQAISDDAVRAAGCDPAKLKVLFEQGVSASRIHQMNGCSADKLKAAGFAARDLLDAGFTPEQLKEAGFSADEIQKAKATSDEAIRAAGCDPAKLKALFEQGVSASRIHQMNGCSADKLKAAGFGVQDLIAAGFTPEQLKAAGFSADEIQKAQANSVAAIRAAGCDPVKLKALFAQGVTASRIHQMNGCSADKLKAAGFGARDLLDAGFTPDELLAAGFTPTELTATGGATAALIAAGRNSDCSDALLKTARAEGISVSTIKNTLGCTAASFNKANYNPAELKAGGFTAAELKTAGLAASNLRTAGYTPKELLEAGFTDAELAQAGFAKEALSEVEAKPENVPSPENNSQVEALPAVTPTMAKPSEVTAIPSIQKVAPVKGAMDEASTQQLQKILARQNQQLSDQRIQQQIQQRSAQMMGVATTAMKNWAAVSTQQYVGGSENEKEQSQSELPGVGNNLVAGKNKEFLEAERAPVNVLIKTGDVIFAVMDTSVNSDEPGPILATVVSGQFKGARLIGSFHLAPNANDMIINFNVMSVPGAQKSTSISAYAIDPNTARTALSSKTHHHYLLRYGSLFAASFLEGFGNAFQSANTTVTIGGTAGGDNVTVQNGIGRSTLQNAVIGMATLGKSWGQVAQQQFNTPTTVEVFSGTPMGILFTQDLTSL